MVSQIEVEIIIYGVIFASVMLPHMHQYEFEKYAYIFCIGSLRESGLKLYGTARLHNHVFVSQ
jgi:hypothetical protein